MNKETQWSKKSIQKGTVIGQLSWYSDWAAGCRSNPGIDNIVSCTQHLALSWDPGEVFPQGVKPASLQGRVYRDKAKEAVLSHVPHVCCSEYRHDGGPSSYDAQRHVYEHTEALTL
jgi:hypothetical protein